MNRSHGGFQLVIFGYPQNANPWMVFGRGKIMEHPMKRHGGCPTWGSPMASGKAPWVMWYFCVENIWRGIPMYPPWSESGLPSGLPDVKRPGDFWESVRERSVSSNGKGVNFQVSLFGGKSRQITATAIWADAIFHVFSCSHSWIHRWSLRQARCAMEAEKVGPRGRGRTCRSIATDQHWRILR